MATYKERTIDACRELEEKYLTGLGPFFQHASCPLCKIYRIYAMCRGCFMASILGTMGCIHFKSYLNAELAHDSNEESLYMPAFKERAKFFRDIIPVLENEPDSKFVPGTWEYFGVNRGL